MQHDHALFDRAAHHGTVPAVSVCYTGPRYKACKVLMLRHPIPLVLFLPHRPRLQRPPQSPEWDFRVHMAVLRVNTQAYTHYTANTHSRGHRTTNTNARARERAEAPYNPL